MRLIDAHKLTNHLQMVQKRDGLWGDIDRVVMEVIDKFVREEPTVDAASPWHRVEDELPEKFVNVILVNKRGKHYDIDKGWWNGYSFDRCAKGIYRNVTHWMPLPEPPKEDTDD